MGARTHPGMSTVLRAVASPLRARLLAELRRREASPVELARQLGESLSLTSYHVRLLARAGLVELVRTRPRRGAVEHHYRARRTPPLAVSVRLDAARADALVRELEAADAGPAGTVGVMVVLGRASGTDDG